MPPGHSLHHYLLVALTKTWLSNVTETQRVIKYLKCLHPFFLITLTWAWLKTSQGQGKVWRGVNKDLGKETSVRENLTLNVKQSSLIYKILFFFGNLQMKFEDQPIFKGLWISLKPRLFGLSYFGLLSHLMMCICIHVFMSCVCVCIYIYTCIDMCI